jgi:phosphoribosylaminoimidazolecarboxamide formyltransferase/IMP cyclohydrolase
VVKHTNPCGLAVHDHQPTAYRRAFEGDSVSAYGGIVGFNRPVTAATAEAMRGVLYHIAVAPDYEPGALEILRRRRQLTILKVAPAAGPGEDVDLRLVTGGALIQTVDSIDEDPASWRVVTARSPSEAELRDLAFAWRAAKHVKSNTIVLAKDNTLVGMGAGQPNRVTSVHLALRIAGEKSKGSSLASDAYFPFADNIEMAASGGVSSIAQPGGSIRDEEVIAAANEADLAMVFTGTRHFKH